MELEKQQPDKKQINYKALFIISMVILFCIGGAYGYQLIQERAYQQGIQDANLFLNQQIASQLENQGYIIYNYPINETTYQAIKLGVIQG